MTDQTLNMRACAASAAVAAGVLSGCATPTPSAWTHERAVRLEHAGLAVEALPQIDRITYFGTADGPNMLRVENLDREPAPDGSYTFFGGCYTWFAPQNGPTGWRDAAGALQAWPPDPAMDTGPVWRTGRTENALTLSGPVGRSGLREEKTFTLVDNATATLAYALKNESASAVLAGTWINTAVDADGAIAVRVPEGTEIYGWDDAAAGRVRSILSPTDSRGWAMIDLRDAEWQGGSKVWFAAPEGTPVEIAIWKKGGRAGGYWLLRSLPAMSATEIAQLREVGEGPVAVYIDPGARLIEAELYGPVATIPPGAEQRATETWRMISSKERSTAVLPR